MGWNVYYTLENGEAVILRCTGDGEPLTFPASVDGCPVTRLGPDCFGGGSERVSGLRLIDAARAGLPPVSREDSPLSRIELPDTLRTIGDRAFARCRSLIRLQLPDRLEQLGVRVFDQCASLLHVEVPDSVSEIPEYTFANCRKLEWVRLPRMARSVGRYAFYNCVKLTGLELPDGLEQVGSCLFMNCRSFHWLSAPHTINLSVLLGELTGEIDLTVRFPDGRARFYLPDFAYEFEEVVMPRAFNTITYGSGQLYRECFSAKGIDFNLYESYFDTALLKDKTDITVRIAWYRLRWPYQLGRQEVYLNHLLEHLDLLMKMLMEGEGGDEGEQELEGLERLLRLTRLTPQQLSALSAQAERAGKVRFVGRLMEAGMGLAGGVDKEFDL
ncbi:MAG: leucine-rich repeat domain-containing protein [Oscillospiraceae bacterium]|nr:leucine-rich repeat domain-containing protein [Oscillospiraceae bacterium]